MNEQAIGGQTADGTGSAATAEAPAFMQVTGAQAVALAALTAGKDAGAGSPRRRGLNPSTLYRWRTEDEKFRDACRNWRQEAHLHCRDRIAGDRDKAIEAVEAGLSKGDARLAFRFLLDLNRKPAPEPPPPPKPPESEQERWEKAKKSGLHEPISKCSLTQIKRMPQMIDEIVEIDNARDKLQPGQRNRDQPHR